MGKSHREETSDLAADGAAGSCVSQGKRGLFSVPREVEFRLHKNGGVLVSTDCLKRRRHAEDGSLASLKSGPKKINADHQDLALAA